MDTVAQPTPAVTTPATAFGAASMMGRLVALTIIVGGMLALAILVLSSTVGGGGRAAPPTAERFIPTPAQHAAALAAWQAQVPDVDPCTNALSALGGDFSAVSTSAAAGLPHSGSLHGDAGAAATDCGLLEASVEAMDLSASPLAQDMQEQFVRVLRLELDASGLYAQAARRIDGAQYAEAVRLMRSANGEIDQARALLVAAASDDLGLDLGG